tara:strand:- start:6498 stop:7238 length:741 start_codon:yes stop_codon:yes gene_type:complete
MHSNKTLVSIITISYNSEKTIARSIESVINSSHKNIELIIIDNKSSDLTLKIINNYRKKSKIIKVISESDLGISDAFNKGLHNSNGSLIGILNSDDWYDYNSIENAVNQYKNGYNVVMGDIIKAGKRYSSSLIKFNLKMTVMHPSCFISASAYKSIGEYNLSYKIAMDYDLFVRIYNSDHVNIKYSKNVLTNMSPDGISNLGLSNKLKSIRECRDIQLHYKLNSNMFSNFYYMLRYVSMYIKYYLV